MSSKDEDFLDLSVDVEQNTSITHCLRYFLKGEKKRKKEGGRVVFEITADVTLCVSAQQGLQQHRDAMQ